MVLSSVKEQLNCIAVRLPRKVVRGMNIDFAGTGIMREDVISHEMIRSDSTLKTRCFVVCVA